MDRKGGVNRAPWLPLALFGGGLALALSIAALSYHQIRRLTEDADWVSHTREVLEEIESLRRFLARAEASQRGWLLTREASFLDQRTTAVRELRSSLVHVKDLTADNPGQQERIRELAPLVDRRLDFLERALSSDPGALRDLIHQGNLVTQQALGILGAMESTEDLLLKSRSTSSKRSANQTMVAAPLSGTASFAVFALGMLLYVRETRRRRRAEEVVREANSRLEEANREIRAAGLQVEAFFMNALDLTCVADLSTGGFIKVNPAWEQVLGWPLQEILARPWLDFVHPDDREKTTQAAETLGVGGRLIRFENRFRCRDGSYRWISWSTAAPGTGTTLLYSAGRDVTELKAAEERILALNKELEAFSYSVSHDLRAPLRHVNGFVELLQKHAAASLDDTGRRYLKTISDSATKMGRLIDDLLSFSRTGRSELKPVSLPMSRLVEEVRRDLEADEQGRAIVWDVKPLPDACGDPALLRQVWANLLSNAVKYTKNNPEARIEVGTVSRNGQGTAYYVRDNGAGFDMRYVDKLFGVFQRLHSAQEFEGTGIGLANVKRIVTRHGGSIWAEGKVGEGATFYFTIPPPPQEESR